jgi:ribosomal silencing factor RsfS
MPRVEAEADWSVVPIGEGICVNLFTAGGRDKWRLDELWQGK